MIKHTLLLLLFCFPIALWAQDDDNIASNPAHYNNFIVAEQSQLMSKVVEYIVQTVHNENFREVESKRLEVIGQIEVSIQRLEALPAFKNDNSMKEEALAVFNLYREAYVNDYSQINMLKQERESSFEAMSSYLDAQDAAEFKLQVSAERFAKAQEAFAEKHGMEIVASQPDGTMRAISEVNKYSRSVFLNFFKVSKLNARCLDAINSQQAEQLEQSRLALLQGTEEAIASLNKIQPFRGKDDEFRSRTLAYVKYHRLFAQEDLAVLVKVLGNSSRSNEDINRFNEIIKAYNSDFTSLVASFNTANENLLRNYIPNTQLVEGNRG